MNYLLGFVVLWLSVAPAAAKVITYACQFNTRVDEYGTKEEPMPLTLKIDTVSRSAFMEGNAGFVEVEMNIGDEAFSFTEKAASGAIQTTTNTRDGVAVHSRNTVILGKIVAAQHLGRCTLE